MKQKTKSHSLVRGIGINDVDYQIETIIDGERVRCPYYIVWGGMLQRCYSPKYHATHPTYINCTVADEWLLFSEFKKWMVDQDWQGKALDKDIIIQGNKHYSPDTCVFVNSATNNLLGDSCAARGQYPQGVSIHAQTGRFRASVYINSKSKYLGSFTNVSEASLAYTKAKTALISRVASEQEDERVSAGLLRHASRLWARLEIEK